MDPVRYSRLKQMAKSPAHYLAAVTEETTSMARGSAVDALLLGTQRVICFPGKVRAGKDWERFQLDNADALVLTRKELDRALAMAAAVRSSKPAMRALDGAHMTEIAWSFLGRECLSHPDVVGDGFVTDLKTTESADPKRFYWAAQRYHYFGQLAFYDAAVRQSGRGDPQAHFIVAVESLRPHPVTVLRLTPRALEQGQREFRLWFETLLACEAANAWPGYCESVVDLDVPDDAVELVYGKLSVTEDGVVEGQEDAA
jgi:hypothetical protein